MNVGDITTRVQRLFGDTTEAEITKADILRWMNDGQIDIVRKTEVLQAAITFQSVANQDGYPLPVDFLFARRVTFDAIEIPSTTLEQISQGKYPNVNINLAGFPYAYYIWGGTFNFDPIADVDDKTVKLWYVRRPAVLVLPADVPDIPIHMHEDIVTYCLWKAKQLDEEDAQANAAQSEYQQRLAESKHEQYTPNVNSYPAVREVEGDAW